MPSPNPPRADAAPRAALDLVTAVEVDLRALGRRLAPPRRPDPLALLARAGYRAVRPGLPCRLDRRA